ncbi:MAG: ATP-dependent helicase, partial [Pedobacter sp.]
MLRVDSSKTCKVVYSLCKHEYLGYLIEPHVVQLNPQGDFSFTYQRIFTHTADEFNACLSEIDYKLIKILDDIEQDSLIKKHYKKLIRPTEFFTKVFDEKFYESVRPKIEKKLAEALEILKVKDELYLMDKDGWPVERKIELASEPASILFHFRRNETETRYFPTIKYQNLRIEFMFKEAQIISNKPAWLLLNDVLYFFDQDIEGKKLQPFLAKRYIAIPKSTEATYFEKFVAPLIEKHHVYAEGFEIKTEQFEATPILKVFYVDGGLSQIQLSFKYGEYVFPVENAHKVTVRLEKAADNYIFHRIKRSAEWEKKQLNWINEHIEILEAAGFEIEQATGQKRFVFGASKIDLEVKEGNDWFDINAVVWFGKYQIPFLSLKQHILHKRREFTLPDGEVAIIPDKWFTQYGSLFSLAESGKTLKLKKHHIGLINDLAEDSLANVTLERKLQRLSDFEDIADTQMPVHFKGNLRDYQKAGYNWFSFLREYNFGGCLADDMGLGKTIQTLAMLQKVKEDDQLAATQTTSLIIMPTSLIYNWLTEAKKFTPKLKILAHTGTNRNKDVANFANYDIIITTYGVTRVDVDELKNFYFNYVILDESQNIKNPASKSFKAVRSLKSRHRLILSGTPVENSVGDLWSQLTFLNPGLLGTQAFFYEEYVQAIEKKKDEEKARKLQSIIKPFVLRRTKEQVASE